MNIKQIKKEIEKNFVKSINEDLELNLPTVRDLSLAGINGCLREQGYKVKYDNYVKLVKYVDKIDTNKIHVAYIPFLIKKFTKMLMADLPENPTNKKVIEDIAWATYETYFDDSIDNLHMIYSIVGDDYVEKYRNSQK